jgi:circadian clock protein KaiB
MKHADAASVRTINLTFYVAGDGQFSRQAKENLKKLIDEIQGGAEVKLNIVDVTEKPEAALSEGIFTTPALIASMGQMSLRFVGDLSERDKVVTALKDD